MGMGVAGMTIHSDYGSLPHFLPSTSKSIILYPSKDDAFPLQNHRAFLMNGLEGSQQSLLVRALFGWDRTGENGKQWETTTFP